jgi:Flp pilus assembly protein TadG
MLNRLPSRAFARLRCNRGSVLILVAAAMFPIIAMLTFAIDVSHWFDYSRNLQNRADAAALAGGQMLGSCIGSTSSPGDTTTGAQSYAGRWAQLFTGASVGENPANLPYTDKQVSNLATAGPLANWDVTKNGYLNNTLTGSPVTSPLTLRAGLANINNFWAALNGNNYPDSTRGNTSFTMNAAGSGATFCNSDPTADVTDKQCFGQAAGQTTGPCAAGPMVDVKLTQQNVPLFVHLFSLTPTIHAHARVTLQGEASPGNVRAIAVSDPGSFACVTVYFKSTADNSTLATAVLTETDPANFVWTNAVPVPGVPNTGPASVTIPTGAHVYMQPFLNDCNGNGETFDDSTNSGIELINSYGTTAPPVDQPPRVTTFGVTLALVGTCATDQYFSVGDCSVQPTAHVTFNPGVTNPNNQASVTAVDTSTGNSLPLSPDNTGTVWKPSGQQHFTIADSSGQHLIRIDWTQKAGSVNGTPCGTGNGQSPPPCTGTLGIQQQAFGACNGCDQPDDSGPIVKSQIRLATDPAGAFGENAFQQGTTQNLVVTLQLAGIRAETDAKAKPTIIRFAGSTNHQTGLVDCGQGGGANLDGYVIYGGCGPSNPFSPPSCAGKNPSCPLPQLNPLFVYGRGNPIDCSPAVDQNYTGWPDGNHQDCVKTTPGTRRQGIVCALVLYMTKQSYDPNSNCNSNGAGVCPANNWPKTDDPTDLRKVTFILTSPLDLAAAGNSPGFWVPIRRFATFYVTGWDPSILPSCAGVNDTYPGTGKKSAQAGTLWGHWIFDVDPGGTPNGGGCDTSSIAPINCVPVLTR